MEAPGWFLARRWQSSVLPVAVAPPRRNALRGGAAFMEPIEQNQSKDADADGAIGDIEGWKVMAAPVAIDEVDDLPAADTVDGVSEDASQQESVEDGSRAVLREESMSPKDEA